MKKKRSTSETTGPIRIVVFKGSQKPTALQLTQKMAIKIYIIAAAIVFFLMFAITILLMAYEKQLVFEDKYYATNTEVERLRAIIRKINEPSESRRNNINKEDEETDGDVESPDESPVTSGTTSSASTKISDVETQLSVPSSAELSAKVDEFKYQKSQTGTSFSFNYWLINNSLANQRLEGRVVVVFQLSSGFTSYPQINLRNGEIVNTKRGIPIRIQYRRKMDGTINLSSSEILPQRADIYVFNNDGQQILKESFEIK